MKLCLLSVNILGIFAGDKDPCDVCFRAKRTTNCFVISENKTNSLFELIHCDIWAPYRVQASCGANYCLTNVDYNSGAT